MNADTAAHPKRTRRYLTPVYDSARWDSFEHRAGDIVVSTPPKSGTTWTQMICALLVHQTPDLPQPLTRLSRWVERHSEPIEQVNAELGAQTHRRVLKTHTPLDGLPYFEDAAYVVCGRDVRDAFLSMLDHIDNTSEASFAEVSKRAGFPPDFQLPDDPNVMFPIWQTTPVNEWSEDGFPFGSFTGFLQSFWNHRRLPNVFFLHYADLKRDLAGEMRRLSAFLGIPIDEAVFPSLVEAAGFEAMKSEADQVAPGAHTGEWASNADFFRMGRMEAWRSVLSPENQELYQTLNGRRLSPGLKSWLENGRAVAGEPREL